MTESDAQKVLYKRFIEPKRHPLAVPNCKALYPPGESDLISVTKAGLVHEFEIKRSEQDFLREFKNKEWKHEVLEEQEAPREDRCTPNYFWFAAPRNICEDLDVPEYAGLICVGRNDIEIREDAPRRHSEHITDRARRYLERGVTVRYWGE